MYAQCGSRVWLLGAAFIQALENNKNQHSVSLQVYFSVSYFVCMFIYFMS